MHVMTRNRVVVTGGLDNWFTSSTGQPASNGQLVASEVREPRLERLLNVPRFYLPPGPETQIGDPNGALRAVPLSVPVYRFPSWYLCPSCGLMRKEPLTAEGDFICAANGCNFRLNQVRFAAACIDGHLQDFPWMEWVHRSPDPQCFGPLRFIPGGSGSLGDIGIKCTNANCGAHRSLAGVMGGSFFTNPETNAPPRSALTSNLSPGGAPFSCQGKCVWHGDETPGQCEKPLHAVLINATNAHYSKIASAIWIPPRPFVQPIENQVAAMLRRNDVAEMLDLMRGLYGLNYIGPFLSVPMVANYLSENNLKPTEIAGIVERLVDGALQPPVQGQPVTDTQGLKYEEYQAFQTEQSPKLENNPDGHLIVRPIEHGDLQIAFDAFDHHLDRVSLVDKLRETRVMYGLSRLLSENPLVPSNYQQMQELLWKTWPLQNADRWLPANINMGEGIFLKFDPTAVTEWEQRPEVINHLSSLRARSTASALRAGRPVPNIEPRMVMLHTFAHLLMKRLTFECGYGSSSLRERIYASRDENGEMAGILIYTAAGDAEGSMGGLVRMGEPLNLTRIFRNAIEEARWCSSDPVCTEIGNHGGQGNDGLNIAACHSCSLAPETSCEYFNAFLDRQLVVDSASGTNVGFFS
jgi:hypothetical protein